MRRVDIDLTRSSRLRLADPCKSATRKPFLLGNWQARNAHRNAGKLHREHVREIRRWAQREGWGLSVPEQARQLQRWYPGVTQRALENVLINESWYDPTYDRERPDPVWWAVTPVLCLLLILGQQREEERRCA
jgi:hypothetical protein